MHGSATGIPLLALSGHQPKSAHASANDPKRTKQAIDPNYGEMLALEIRALLILILLASSRPKS